MTTCRRASHPELDVGLRAGEASGLLVTLVQHAGDDQDLVEMSQPVGVGKAVEGVMGGSEVAAGDGAENLLAAGLGQPAQRRPRPLGGQQ